MAAGRALHRLPGKTVGKLQPAIARRAVDNGGHDRHLSFSSAKLMSFGLSKTCFDFLVKKDNYCPDAKWQTKKATTIETINHGHDGSS